MVERQGQMKAQIKDSHQGIRIQVDMDQRVNQWLTMIQRNTLPKN